MRNSGPLTGQGLELEYEQRWLDRYSLRTGYTFQQPRGDGGRPENAPRHMLKANLGAELGGGFIAGLEGQYVSTRLTGDGGRRVPDYAIANLNLRYLPAGQEGDEIFLQRIRHGATRDGRVYMPPFEGILSQEAMWTIRAWLDSPITGGDGNREFFIWLNK